MEGHIPLRITLPLAHQITGTNAEESALRLRCHRLGEVALPRTRWSIKQNASPRRALAREQMRKLDWQDDCLLQRLFGDLEPRAVVPANVRLVDKYSAREACTELLHLRVLFSILVVLPVIRRVLHALVLNEVRIQRVAALTFCPPHRVPRSPSRSLLSPVERAFHLPGPND